MSPGRRWKAVALAFAAALATGALGGLATDIGPWYRALEKPSWQPPDWLFGPVWTTIYALGALAAAQAWWRAPDWRTRRATLGLWFLNLFLNVLWSLLFFAMQRPDWALLEVVPLWLSVLLLVRHYWPYSRASALMLLPYLAWVAFAAWLNWTIVRLNGPFPVAG